MCVYVRGEREIVCMLVWMIVCGGWGGRGGCCVCVSMCMERSVCGDGGELVCVCLEGINCVCVRCMSSEC